MDGGSSDDSLRILEKYRGRLEFHSRQDRGTADAINRGFERSRGSVFAYLNADDTYLPGAITTAVQNLMPLPGIGVVYGDANWVDEEGRVLAPYPTKPYEPSLLSQECFICQPATFIRREAFELAGLMDPKLQYAFDYDLWIRLSRFYPIRKVDCVLATSRMHKENKTVGQRQPVPKETLQMLRCHYGYVPFPPRPRNLSSIRPRKLHRVIAQEPWPRLPVEDPALQSGPNRQRLRLARYQHVAGHRPEMQFHAAHFFHRHRVATVRILSDRVGLT